MERRQRNRHGYKELPDGRPSWPPPIASPLGGGRGVQCSNESLGVDLDKKHRVDPVPAVGILQNVERRHVQECPAQTTDQLLAAGYGQCDRDIEQELLEDSSLEQACRRRERR